MANLRELRWETGIDRDTGELASGWRIYLNDGAGNLVLQDVAIVRGSALPGDDIFIVDNNIATGTSISGGGGNDTFQIASNLSGDRTITIDDLIGTNTVVFTRDVHITSVTQIMATNGPPVAIGMNINIRYTEEDTSTSPPTTTVHNNILRIDGLLMRFQIEGIDSAPLTAAQFFATYGSNGYRDTNVAPTLARPDSTAIESNENQMAVTTLTVTDPGDATHTWVLGGADADLFTLTPTTNLDGTPTGAAVIMWKEDPDFENPDLRTSSTDTSLRNTMSHRDFVITVTVTDAGRLSDSIGLTIRLTNVAENTAPQITAPDGSGGVTVIAAGTTHAVSTPEGRNEVIDLGSTDAQSDAVSWSLDETTGDHALFNIDSATGVITWIDTPDFETTVSSSSSNNKVFSLTVIADDGNSNRATARTSVTITIMLTDVNEAPVIDQGDDTLEVNSAENQNVAVAVSALTATDTETDSADLRWSLTGGADVGLFNIDEATGEITWNPDNPLPDYETLNSADNDEYFEVMVTVTDDGNPTLGDDINIAITLTNVNEAPEHVRAAVAANADETVVLDTTHLLTTDVDDNGADELTYTITVLATTGELQLSGTALQVGGTFTQEDVNNGRVSFVTNDGTDTGVTSFTLSVADDDGLIVTFDDGQGGETNYFTLDVSIRVDNIPDSATKGEANTINAENEMEAQNIEAGDGHDEITDGAGNDRIEGGLGDDDIALSTGGADEIIYRFGAGGVAEDGGDGINNFKRGEDKLVFAEFIQADDSDATVATTLDEFFTSVRNGDAASTRAGSYTTGDLQEDLFILTPNFELDENDVFFITGITFNFRDVGLVDRGGDGSNAKLAGGLLRITFDTPLTWDAFSAIVGADSIDFNVFAFKDPASILDILGPDSFEFRAVDNEATATLTITHTEASGPSDAANIGEMLMVDVTDLADPNGSVSITGYQWYVNNFPINGALTATLDTTGLVAGNYHVVVTTTDVNLDTTEITSAGFRVLAAGVPVNQPPVISHDGEVVADDATVEVESAEDQAATTPVVAATLTVSDARTAADGFEWTLAGDDAGRFNVADGVITWANAPDYEDTSLVSATDGTKVFRVTATVADDEAIALMNSVNLEITLTDVLETAPVITYAIENFMGRRDVNINGVNDNDGIFHHTATIAITGGVSGTTGVINISAGAQAYLPDGSVVDILSGAHTVIYDTTDDYEVWIEDRDDDGIWEVQSGESQPSDTQVYALGQYDFGSAGNPDSFTLYGTAVTDDSFVIAADTTLAVESDEGQDAVITLSATDATPNGRTWVLSGDDMASFALTVDTDGNAVITWDETPDFETMVSTVDTKMFDLTATVTDDGELMDTIDITVTLVDVLETAPVITYAIENFMGRRDVNINGVTDNDGVFHHTATIAVSGNDDGVINISAGAQAYLPDGSVVDIQSGAHTVSFGATSGYQVWLEDRDDNGIWEVQSGESQPSDTQVYALGQYDFGSGASDSFTLYGTAVTDDSFVITADTTLAVDSRENQDAVATLTATAASSVTWSLHGDNIALIDSNPLLAATGDAALFEISDTGVITWVTTPDFETASSDRGTKEFTFAARVTDGNGNTDTTIVTVTLTDEDFSTGTFAIDATSSQVFGVNAAGTPAASLDALDFTSGTATVVGTYGDFTLSLSGTTVSWVYALDNTRAVTRTLESGEIAHETFRLQSVVDGVAGEIQTFEADVVGVNAAPTIANTAITVQVAAGASFTIQSLAALIGYDDADGTLSDSATGQHFFSYAVLNLDGLGEIEGEFSSSFRGRDTVLTESTSILTYLRTNPRDMKFQADDDAAGSSFTFTLTVGDEIDGRAERSDPISVTVEVAGGASGTAGSSVTTLMSGDGTAADTLDAHDAPNGVTIQGGALADIIIGSAHGDIIAGGYGDDSITLGDGADKVVYRWESGATSTATDGGDTVTDFTRGEDQLVLIDVDTASPITSFSGFLDYAKGADTVAGSADDLVTFAFTDDSADALTSLEIIFANAGTTDGTTTGGADSNRLTITFESAIDVATQQAIFRTPDTTDFSSFLVEEGGKLVLQSKYETIDDILGKTAEFDSIIFDDDTTSLGFDIL